MSGAVEKIKDALHLGHSHRHDHTHDVAPIAGTTATTREEERLGDRERQPVHREEETGEALPAQHKHRLPAIGERLKVWMPFGKHDRHAPEEREEHGRTLQEAGPSSTAPSGHEPIAPPTGVTSAPEFPPGPAGKIGYGTAGEGVAAVEDAQGGSGAPVSTGEPAHGATTTTAAQRMVRTEEEQRERQPRGQVCDSKTIRVVEERPIEKEVVETVIEHHPVETEYVVETRPLGEHEIVDEVKMETLGVRERIIAEGKPTVVGAGVEPGPSRSRGAPSAMRATAEPYQDAARAPPQPVRGEQHEIIRPRIP